MATKKVVKSKTDQPSPPRWTYTVAAIVSIVALGWTIVSYFIPPKPKPEKPVAAAPPTVSPQGAGSVTVDGSGSVGVGNMSGGSITLGVPDNAKSPNPPARSAR